MAGDDRTAQRRRFDNATLALPVFGAMLIVPPLIGVFNAPWRVFGLPVGGLYLLVVWTMLIGAAFWLARQPAARGRSGRGASERGG